MGVSVHIYSAIEKIPSLINP